MKKRIIISAIALFMLGILGSGPIQAQIYLMDDEINTQRADYPEGGFIIPDVPDHDTTWDYTPIGSGLWLLGGLAGAYLLGKRRKKEES